MTTEPFRYDQGVLDVSDMNVPGPLRSSMNPFRLGLSSDLLSSSHDLLGRSADGTAGLAALDSAFGSSPALMASHQKAMNNNQLASPLSSSIGGSFGGAIAGSLMTGTTRPSMLSSLTSTAMRDSPSLVSVSDVSSTVSRDPYIPPRNANSGPQPLFTIPPALSGGPTLQDFKAMSGSDVERLRLAQQAALSQQATSTFAQFLHRDATNSPTPGSSAASSTPSTTASGHLRFSGDRFASSAFSPVSPGTSTPQPKLSNNPYTPSSTPNTQLLAPLAHAASSLGTLSSSPSTATTPGMLLSSPFSPPPLASTPGTPAFVGSHFVSGPFTPSSDSTNTHGLNAPAFVAGPPSVSVSSNQTSPNSSERGPPLHKRPYLGTPSSDAPHLTSYAVGSSPSDEHSSVSTPAGRTPSSSSSTTTFLGATEELRTHNVARALTTFNQSIALANNAVKQENMVIAAQLGEGYLKGPASAAFSYQGKAIPYSAEEQFQHYSRLDEANKAQGVHIRTQLDRARKIEAQANGTDDNYLSEAHMEHRKNKKLHPLTYDALYRAIAGNYDGTREKYMLNEHPQVNSLNELPGMVYFLQVQKGSRKPPHVGFPFRSYSDSHYTSVDRDTPIICKVKEWPVDNDAKNIWRLYHYYLGNKKRAPRKRKRADDSDND